MERAYPVLSKALEGQALAGHALEDQSESVEYGSAATEVLCGTRGRGAQAPERFSSHFGRLASCLKARR